MVNNIKYWMFLVFSTIGAGVLVTITASLMMHGVMTTSVGWLVIGAIVLSYNILIGLWFWYSFSQSLKVSGQQLKSEQIHLATHKQRYFLAAFFVLVLILVGYYDTDPDITYLAYGGVGLVVILAIYDRFNHQRSVAKLQQMPTWKYKHYQKVGAVGFVVFLLSSYGLELYHIRFLWHFLISIGLGLGAGWISHLFLLPKISIQSGSGDNSAEQQSLSKTN